MNTLGVSTLDRSFDPSAAPAIHPVVRRGGNLLVDRFGEPLPVHRCFKCNGAARHQVRKTFASTGGFLRFLVVLQPLLILLLLPYYLLRQERVSVAFGLCEHCLERRHLAMSFGVCFLFGSVPLLVYGALTLASTGLILALGGACLFGAGLLTIVSSRHVADSKRLDDRWLILRGGGLPFLEAFPEVPNPRQ